jgi:glycosyltransferase involved in cell wall biosynthesis
MDAASEEVVFPGAIYDARTVRALRFHARFYLHGHKVGGTNPSLVEALGAGNAIIAHDNVFNRWVAGAGGRYFASQSQCEDHIAEVLGDDDTVAMMRASSVERFANAFRWDGILDQYEMLLERYCDVESRESIPTPKPLGEKPVGAGNPVR